MFRNLDTTTVLGGKTWVIAQVTDHHLQEITCNARREFGNQASSPELPERISDTLDGQKTFSFF